MILEGSKERRNPCGPKVIPSARRKDCGAPLVAERKRLLANAIVRLPPQLNTNAISSCKQTGLSIHVVEIDRSVCIVRGAAES